MKENSIWGTAVRSMAYFLLILLATPILAQATETIITAPLNPNFTNYIKNKQISQNQLLQSSGQEHALGYIPSPVDRSYLKNAAASKLKTQATSLPTSYDLRTSGKVTPVRDQGSCGDCWAFAAMGSAESNLLPAETRDFSENNLKDTAGFVWGACDGGNEEMSTAYLARWSGPINESDDPYNPLSSVSPTGLTTQKHYQDVLFLPGRQSATDNDTIKQALMNYGAVATYYFQDSANYNASTYGYYYSGTSSSNHAITIVGWDDNFPASSFPITPPGNGAFIIKNSWGTGWGYSGYFYISYYDTTLGMDGNYVFVEPGPTTNYNNVYQYDPLGNTSNLGYSSDTAWFANIFTAAAGDNLSAVSFYTATQNSTYAINIYTNVGSTPTSGTFAGSTTGSIAEAGYHTVTLPSPVQLTSGQNFSIVVQLTTPGYNYPITMETPVTGYASPTAGAGQSFISYGGTSWTDITSYYANTNVCLKGFTVGDPDYSISSSPVTVSVAPGGAGTSVITTSAIGSFNNAISLSVSGLPSGATATFSPTSISAPGSGSSTLTLTAGPSTPTGSYTVTVTGIGGGKTHTSTITFNVTYILFSDGFEGSGWSTAQVLGAGSWTFESSGSNPTVSPHGGTKMAKFNSYAAPSGTQTRLYQTTGIPISNSYDSVTLSFWMYHDAGYSGSADQVQAQVSTDGNTWTNVGPPTKRYNGTNGWAQATLDLSAYRGYSNLQIGFLGTSDFGNNIYLDDAAVRATATADTTPPTVTSTSPTAGASGVAVTTTVTATFSEDMDATTIKSSTFTLNNGVTGTVSYNAGTRTATLTPSANLASGTVYTATITTGVKDAAGNPMSAAKIWSFTTAASRTLSVTFGGTGSGSVNSNPSGIACSTGNSGTSSYQFANGTSVTLIPTASGDSLFNGWTGACTSNSGNDCIVTMDSDKSFTANFRKILPVMIKGGSDFSSLQAACDSQSNGAFTLMAQDVELTGDLTLDNNNAVSMKGGFNSDYSSNTGGITVLDGILTSVNGSLTVEYLAIK